MFVWCFLILYQGLVARDVCFECGHCSDSKACLDELPFDAGKNNTNFKIKCFFKLNLNS